MIDAGKAKQLAEEIYADLETRKGLRASVSHSNISHFFTETRTDRKEVYDEIISDWTDLILDWTRWTT